MPCGKKLFHFQFLRFFHPLAFTRQLKIGKQKHSTNAALQVERWIGVSAADTATDIAIGFCSYRTHFITTECSSPMTRFTKLSNSFDGGKNFKPAYWVGFARKFYRIFCSRRKMLRLIQVKMRAGRLLAKHVEMSFWLVTKETALSTMTHIRRRKRISSRRFHSEHFWKFLSMMAESFPRNFTKDDNQAEGS